MKSRRIFHPEKPSGKKSRIAARAFAFIASAALLAPKPLLACAVCMGGADTNVRPAINAAIFLMLGFIGTMLTGIGGFAFYLSRRARQPHPEHEQFLGLNEEEQQPHAP